MQINIIPKVKEVKTEAVKSKTRKAKDTKAKDFDSTLKDCEEDKKTEKDDGSEKANNNTIGILGALAVSLPINLKTVKPESVMPSVDAAGKVGSVTDESPKASGASENIQTGPIDSGFSKLIVENPLIKSKVLPDTPKDVSENNVPQILIKPKEDIKADNSFKNTLQNPGIYKADITADSKASATVPVNTPVKKEILTSDIKTSDLSGEINVTAKSDLADKQNINNLQTDKNIQAVTTVKTDSVPMKPKNAEAPVKTAETEVSAAVNTPKAFEGKKENTESGKKDDTDFANNPAAVNIGQVGKTQNSEKFPQQLKVNTANQVADAVNNAVQNGRTEVRIHLNPENLGPISVRIVSQNGAISVQISADNEKTGQLIASSMHELSQSMQDKGLTMEKAEVTYADNSSSLDTATSQQGQQFAQNEQYRQNDQNGDYSLPKWTVAMETKGKTAKDSASPIKGVEAVPDNSDDSSYSILV